MIQDLCLYHIEASGVVSISAVLPYHKYVDEVKGIDIFEFKLMLRNGLEKEGRNKFCNPTASEIEDTHMVVIIFLKDRNLIRTK